MKKYCAFLKQVSFHNKFIKMNDIKILFETMGFSEVISVLATGNIIFYSDKDKTEIYSLIKTTLIEYYSFDIDIFIKDIDEIKNIIDNNPFKIDTNFILQTFICNSGFEIILMDEFNKITPLSEERAIIINNNFYWYFSKLIKTNSNFLKVLSKTSLKHNFTLRTIGSLNKVWNKII